MTMADHLSDSDLDESGRESGGITPHCAPPLCTHPGMMDGNYKLVKQLVICAPLVLTSRLSASPREQGCRMPAGRPQSQDTLLPLLVRTNYEA